MNTNSMYCADAKNCSCEMCNECCGNVNVSGCGNPMYNVFSWNSPRKCCYRPELCAIDILYYYLTKGEAAEIYVNNRELLDFLNEVKNVYETKEHAFEILQDLLDKIDSVTASCEWDDIKDKPSFATVATSGDYGDLDNKPVFKTIDNKSILGDGNIEIVVESDDHFDENSENSILNRIVANAINTIKGGSDKSIKLLDLQNELIVQRVDSLESAVGTGGSVDTRILSAVSAEAAARQAGDEQLIALYEALAQSDIIVVVDHTKVSSPETNTIYREYGDTSYSDWMYYDGNWYKMAEYDNAVDDAPTAGSDNLVRSGGVQNELALGAVYDVSAKNPTAGPNNDGKFESLSALLSDNNLNTLIPTSVRRGGMSIKYVQSSDNKYVQARCIADEFTTDTTQWVIAEEGSYVENPEYIYVKIDTEGKILWAIKTDGSIYYGAGVPQQVIDYIEEKLANFSPAEYDDIVAFLNSLEKGDKTLQDLLDEKVDKEEGKSLIDAEYADGVSQIENPEFIKAELDAEQKLLGGIKKDGTYWFNKIKSPTLDNLQKEVTDAIEESQEALAEHYDYYNVSKHHTIRDVFNIYTANTGWQQVEYDSTVAMYDELDVYQIGEVCNYDGDTEHSYEATTRHRGVAPAIVTQEYVTRRKFTLDEAISVLPAEVLLAFAAGQKICFVDTDDIIEEWEIQENGLWVRLNPYTIKDLEDRIEIKLDAEDKVVAYRKADGTWVENVGIEAPNLGDYQPTEEGKGLIDKNVADSLSCIEDPEDRHEITLDAEERIVSYRKPDGTKVENVGIETNKLTLTEKGMTEFQKALKDSGFRPGGAGDYSDTITEKGKKPVFIPTPRLARVNIIWDGNLSNLSKSDRSDGVQKVNYDVKVPVEFFDGQGVYFKKYVLMSAQGNSSMAFEKKNISLKFFDTEDVEGKKKKWGKGDTFGTVFGDWVMQKTYHLKAFHTDFIRGSSEVAYQLADEVYKTRGIYEDRPWKKALIDFSKITSVTPAGLSKDGMKDMALRIDNGARCMPDGFPVIVYQNGEFYGIYVWMLKKDADNFNMDTADVTHIHLDGTLSAQNFFGGTVNWTAFEIRNPEDLICMDGSDYDGDFPKELIDNTSEYYDNTDENHVRSAQVKQYIIEFSHRVGEINTLNATDSATAKTLFDTYFDADNLIDYQLINMACGDPDGFEKNWQWTTWDGVKWYVNQYDKDMSFGNYWTGMFTTPPITGWIKSDENLPVGIAIRYYLAEHKTRWQQLVSAGIFTADHIKSLITDWVKRIGQANYENEWKKWPEAPCNRNSMIDYENWRFKEGIRPPYIPSGVWNSETEYAEGDNVWFPAFDSGWYLGFTAVKSNTNKPPLTGSYTKYPMSMGYRDSAWRFYKYIDETIQNQNTFINSLNV